MRVAYVSADQGVPVFGQKGCSIHTQEVLRGLSRQGAEVELFSTRCEGEPPEDLRTIRLHPPPRPTQPDVALREQVSLVGNLALGAELEAAGPFDLVYERYSLWSFAAMEFARDAGVTGMLEVNAPLIEEQATYRVLVDRPAAEAVAERTFGAASLLLAVSGQVAAYLEEFPSARGKVRVVPNAVRTERFHEGVEPALPASDGVFTVGFVGTLKAWHGVEVLLEAFAQIQANHKAVRLLIVGDGPERAKLVARCVELKVADEVVFTGAVAPSEVPAFLASMDVAVAPYPNLARFYFSPLKVYEYMAAGLPVVASGIGQLEELIEPGVNGLLVMPGDAKALKGALETLQADVGLRRRLGHAARAKVLHKHTWDSVARHILELAGASKLEMPPV